MVGGTVCLEALLEAAQVVARSQLKRRGEPLDLEDELLEVLWPHRLQVTVRLGQGLNDAPILNAGKVQSGLTSKGRAGNVSWNMRLGAVEKAMAYRKHIMNLCSCDATDALKRVSVTVP